MRGEQQHLLGGMALKSRTAHAEAVTTKPSFMKCSKYGTALTQQSLPRASSHLSGRADETTLAANDGQKIQKEVLLRGAPERLVSLYQRELESFFLRRVSRKHEAEDLVQEVWVRTFVRLGNFEGRSTLRSWLFAIARNLLTDHYRRDRHRKSDSVGDMPREEDGEAAVILSTHPDCTRTACDARIGIKGCLACVRKNLPIEQQVAVLLCDVHGFSVGEAAPKVGISPGKFKHRLRAARLAMDRIAGGNCALVRKTGGHCSCVPVAGMVTTASPAENAGSKGAGLMGDGHNGNGDGLRLLRDQLMQLLD